MTPSFRMNHIKAPNTDHNYPGLQIENFDSSGELSIELDAGHVLIFNSLLAHRSGRNCSDQTRLALAFAIHKRGYVE